MLQLEASRLGVDQRDGHCLGNIGSSLGVTGMSYLRLCLSVVGVLVVVVAYPWQFPGPICRQVSDPSIRPSNNFSPILLLSN